jgi:hypothetical protein
MVINFNQMFNMGANIGRLKFLSLDPERKVQFYNGYFVNGYMFHIDSMVMV